MGSRGRLGDIFFFKYPPQCGPYKTCPASCGVYLSIVVCIWVAGSRKEVEIEEEPEVASLKTTDLVVRVQPTVSRITLKRVLNRASVTMVVFSKADESCRSSTVLWCVLVGCAFLAMVNAARLEASGQGYYDEDGLDSVSGRPVYAGEGSLVVPKPNVSDSGTPENAPRGVPPIVTSVKETTVSSAEDIELAVENIYTNMTTVDSAMPMENITTCAGYQVGTGRYHPYCILCHSFDTPLFMEMRDRIWR